jgi:beta-N-acetylhexosaminidase
MSFGTRALAHSPPRPLAAWPRRPLAHSPPRRVSGWLWCGVVALGITACAQPIAPPAPAPVDEKIIAANWVNSTFSALTLEEKVGQMLVTRTMGDFRNASSPDFLRLQHDIRDLHVGGVTVSIGSPPEIAAKVNALQRVAKVPLLVSADLEYGSGMRLWSPVYLPYLFEGGGGTIFPYNMGVAATGDPALADTIARITAREARAVGINWLFGPVVDVNTNAANPIVNVRSYGSDPASVARFASAYIRGANSAGVLTSAKHFPGHGDTGVDSHVSMPVLSVDPARLDSLELVPFRAAIDAGVSSFMLGHLAVPALTGGSKMPATVSREIATDLLRTRMGYKGIVITDAMTMGALKELPGYSPGDIAVRAVEAGSDVVLWPPDMDAAYTAILAAVKSGRIPTARIDASVRRILEAKARVRLYRSRAVSLDSVAEIVGAPAHERAAATIAARSIVLVRDSANVIPIDPRRHRTAAVIAFTSPTDLTGGRVLATELRRIYGNASATRLDETSSPAAIDSALARAAAADFTVFATFFGPVAGQGFLRVPEPGRALAARLHESGRPVVTISFGDPYGPSDLPGASTYMLAWQPRGAAAQIAAAQALAGIAAIGGRLPVELRGAPRGSGITRTAQPYVLSFARPEDVGMDPVRLERVDEVVNAAIADHASPGVALAIGRNGRIVKMRGYGNVDYRAGFPSVNDSTMYDLASLTKVVATTNAAMMLYDEGRLDLDAPIARYLPEWQPSEPCPQIGVTAMPAPAADGGCRGFSAEKARATVRQLLTHSAGLRAWSPLYASAHGRAQYIEGIAALPLEYAPGTNMIYSDLSMILMQAIVERIAGEPLDVFMQKRLFGPMGMRDTRFNPMRAPGEPDSLGCLAGVMPNEAVLARIAPTEIRSNGQQIYGTVHDDNACAIGGVSGHAGLFSSARDLAALAEMLMDGGFYAGQRFIRPSTVDLFTTRQDERSSRALGWDTPAFGASNGDYFSEHSFGHTGFTGTSIWVDKDKQLFVVLLTNRVNPGQGNEKHLALRRAVQDAVALAVADMPVTKPRYVVEGEVQRAIARAAAEKERKRALRARRGRHKSASKQKSAKQKSAKRSTPGKKKPSAKASGKKKPTAKASIKKSTKKKTKR